MGSICGIFYKKGQKAAESEIKTMLNSLNHWGTEHQWFSCEGNVAFGKLSLLPVESPKIDNLPFFTASSRLDNIPDEVQLITLIKKNGERILKTIYGDFVFGFYENNMLTLGRDHFGAKPLFYHDSHEVFAFASEMKGLFSLLDIPKKLSGEWLFDLLSNSISGKHVTPYIGIKRLKPGHVLKITPEKTQEIEYWDLIHGKNEVPTGEEAVKEFRSFLIKSVEDRSKSRFPVGSELSGGLDSSTITSIAASSCKNQKIPFYSLSHVNPDLNLYPFKDELEYINQLVNFAGIENTLFINPEHKGILSSIDESIILQDAPTQQRFYLFSDCLYETAKRYNIHTLLSGFGGDEMVSSQTPGYFHELAKNDWYKFINEQFKRKRNPVKKVSNIFEISIAVKLPAIYKAWISFAGKERKRIARNLYSNNALRKKVIKKYNLVRRALPKARFPNQPSIHERQYQRIMHPHLPQRLEYSAIAALHHKIEYRYPLLDVRLVEFYYSLPTHLKINGETRRYIYRRVIKDIVPESIRWRNDKSGATIPSVQKRFLNDYENIKEFIKHCKKNGVGDEYFNLGDMLSWQEAIKNRTNSSKTNVHQGQFFNFLMLLRFLDKF